MKIKTLILILLAFSINSKAQVAIGKTSVNTNVILDFGQENEGIILPVITTLPVFPANGTFVMDGRTGQQKVKVFENEVWKDLSDSGSLAEQTNSGVSTTTATVINSSSEIGSGLVIGNVKANGEATSGATGVLVLEATDKALVLPKVTNPHLNIKSPRAGTICFDQTSKTLAVFDGVVWNYWK
ncbi:hypothetical protein [Epilithonimonas sp.]|uniref:hypothetical protein n=1 Tax=Epilithonimonas sp. TaxID=2894511 RepID=UPI002896902B|nr:hypothetical protein [Epilithonimonas sp.]